jgi:hypothetical protein
MCFSLTLPDDQLADMAVAGMLPVVREKLFGMEFDNLGQLSQKLSLMSNQAYGFKKNTRFAKHHDIADIYNQFLEKADQVEDFDDDEEVAAAEIMRGKEPFTVNQRWIKQTKGTFDFDVTKADKLFEFLVKEGRIKLPEGHSMLRPDGVREKRYCGFHDRNSHSINDCRVFRMRIQKAIQEGHLKFDNKMKLDGHPFPQNMVGFSVNMVTAEEKGKVKVLTSTRAKQGGSVDPAQQVTVDQVRMEAPHVLKSQIEVGESSGSKPRVTTRILLNKWQRQQEKERYQKRKYEEERRRFEEEARREELKEYAREQERTHWGCAFFRHCWNEGLKLPTLKNCPECSDKYFEYRQETVNRRSVHERIGRMHPSDYRRKKIEVIDHPRKRQANQRWADQEEEEREYVWQEGKWCPPGLRKSQKRRVQRLRNRELKQAGIQRKQVWCPRGKPEGSGRSAPACMVYFLPNEFMAPANQVVQEEAFLEANEDEQLERVMAQLVLAKKATFDKPARNQHMRPLYLKRYVNGKPLTKMFVDGGAAVNVMLYTTFRKLGMGPGDLTPTSIILNDFAGNPSDTKGCVHVDLMIGSKTLLTTFFVIEGNGAYSLLLGRDWIHTNCCIPSTMHQQLIQWVDDDIEVVQADDSVSVANVEQAFWEYQGIDCFSGKDWGEAPVEPVSSDQQPIQAVGSYSNF